MSDGAGVVLFNEAGTQAVGVVFDGVFYRLQTEAQLKSAAKGTAVAAGITSTPIDANTEALHVDGSKVTQPISAASLPLPAGSATEATLASLKDTDGIKKITDPLPVGTNEIGAVAQGTKAVAADAWPTAIYDASGNAVGVLLDGVVYRLQVQTRFEEDREKVVAVAFGKEGAEAPTATAYYMGVDVSNTSDFPHAAGSGIKLVHSIGRAVKSNAGSSWSIQVMVVLRIDETDSDLAVIGAVSMSLRDTSKLSIDGQSVNLWPHFADLTVSGNELTNIATNLVVLNVPAVNTSVLLEDAVGNTVAAAEGDLLIRVLLLSGGGNLEFAYAIQYFVE